MHRLPAWIRHRAPTARAGAERGAAAVYAVIILPVLLVTAAIAVDLTSWYAESQTAQKAADAAALAAAPFMPTTILSDQSDPASSAAVDVLEQNGFSGADAVVSQATNALGNPAPGAVRVTLTSEVTNVFAGLAGVPTTTIVRSAVANFTGPAPLGSPCNIFGRQDMETLIDGSGNADETTCGIVGKYWVNIAGENTNKARGDGFASRYCGRADASDGRIDRCQNEDVSGAPNSWSTANPNLDYEVDGEDGYVFVIKPAVSGTIRLQAYDLGWVAVGDNCNQGILSSDLASDTSNFYVSAGEGAERYKRGNDPENPFCSGDTEMGTHNGDSGASGPVVTTVTVRGPSPNPFQPLLGTPLTGCDAVVYPGWRPNTPQSALAGGDANRSLLARTFHRWMDPCAQASTESSDESITSGTGDYLEIPSVVAGEEYSIQIQTSGGGGQNRFALRAQMATGGAVQIGADRNVSLFNNVPAGTSRFNVVRLDSATAGRNLTLRFFDLADAADDVTTTVLQPDSDTPFEGCTGFGPVGGTAGQALTLCSVTTDVTTTGGKWQTIRIPIDEDYTCSDDADRSKCWVRVELSTTSSQADTTTWTAGLDGDPVRLEQ